MIKTLDKVITKININDYSLRDLAIFFEKYDKSILVIETEHRILKCKISKNILSHLIGMHYAYANHQNKNLYKGLSGFNMLKRGNIKLEDLRNNIIKNTKSKLAWKNIKNRIEYLPMFFNLLDKKTRLKILELNYIYYHTKLKGNYALFRIVNDNIKEIYPLLSLKEINREESIIETFIIENDISLLGALKEEKIQNITLLKEQPIFE